MSSSQPPSDSEPAKPPEEPAEEAIHIPDLPLAWRIVLLALSWIVILLGIAGLVLPGLQGILMIALGLAILSVASNTVHSWLEKMLAGRPRWRRRLNHLRDKVHRWLGHEPRIRG